MERQYSDMTVEELIDYALKYSSRISETDAVIELSQRVLSAQRALDAVQKRLNGQIDYSIKLQRLIESLKYDETPLPELYHHKIIAAFKAQLATLQAQLKDKLAVEIGVRHANDDLHAMLGRVEAQLRQMEGEKEVLQRALTKQVDATRHVVTDLTTLRQLVEALPVCVPVSFQIFEAADGNGYDVHGAIKEPYSVGWIGTFLHKAEAESYIHVLQARATLAAQDAGNIADTKEAL